MPEFITKLQQQFAEFWKGLDKSQKNRIYITSAISIVIVAIAIFMITKTNYVTLISISDTKEIGEMMKVLDENNIKSKLGDSSKSILVNEKDMDKAQAAITMAGYPKTSGTTFEDAINSISLTTTESDKRKIWQNESESKIASKLRMMENIEDASVTLALPEDTGFIQTEEEDQPTAAVSITPNGQITAVQVEAIEKLVASSVEGLDPKAVTVVNNLSGQVVSSKDEEEATAPTSQFKMIQEVKNAMEESIRVNFSAGEVDLAAFDTMKVMVNPYLDFNKQKTQTDGVIKPDGEDKPGKLSEETTKETLENGDEGGAPGMVSNPGETGNPTYPNGTEEDSNYDKSHTITNYIWGKYTKIEEKALGEFVPDKSSMTAVLYYGNKVPDDSSITPEFLDNFKASLSTATGIPIEKISISKFKLRAPEAPSADPLSKQVKDLVNDYGIFALLSLLILGLVIAAIPRKKREVIQNEQVLNLEEIAAADGPRFIIPDDEEPVPEIEFEERSEIKKQIDKFVKQKPEAVAQLLRNWISDEWD